MEWDAPMNKLNKTGDTIIEVLLSLAVLGMVIGTAYAIASRSLKRAQQAQERTEATKLVEGQIDRIKYLSESNLASDIVALNDITTSGAAMCLKPFIDIDSGQTIIKAYIVGDDCKEGIFNYSISYDNARYLFTVKTIWYSLGSSGEENTTMQYRAVRSE
jgi:type II secretory pathway pseudopilin PulG